MKIVMTTDIGNKNTMKEIYELPKGVDMDTYANGLIEYYNDTIESPFDMPRKLVTVREVTTKDFLDSYNKGKTEDYAGIENCWVSPYGHVFRVCDMGHDDFMYSLIDTEWFKDYEFNDMEKLGWVRISTSSLSHSIYFQSLKRLTAKQKLTVEKILLINHEHFFPKGEGETVYCRESDFTYQNNKIVTKQKPERYFRD